MSVVGNHGTEFRYVPSPVVATWKLVIHFQLLLLLCH